MDFNPPYMSTTRHSDDARIMYVWVQQALERYLLENPEKAIELNKQTIRHPLIRIVIDLMDTCPVTHNNFDYRNDWLTVDMVNCVRRVVKRTDPTV
jgi:hypothetical protein